MTRPQRVILIVVGVILLAPLVLLGAAVLVAQSEWSERWIEKRVALRTGREAEIDGIKLYWGWPPGISIDRLRIGNPEWARSRDLVNAELVRARVEIPPLFHRKIVIPFIGARSAEVGLERTGDKATWRFGEGERKESPFTIARVVLEDGDVVYRDEDEKTDMAFKVRGSLGEAEGELNVEGQGKFRGESAKGTAVIPRLAPRPGLPIPIDAKATLGKTQVAADGTFAPDFGTADLDFKLAGTTLKDLHRVFGINLPDTPPYRVSGHLKHNGDEWIFSPFEGKVGDSDLRGSVTYRVGPPRKFFQADLRSNLLDFDDLGPIVGAPPQTGAGETASAEQKAKAAQVAASRKVLPSEKFSTERWDEMDADVKLEAKKVQRPKKLPIESLRTHVVLKDSVMHLKPLNFGVAGGRVTSDIVLDGRKKPARGEIRLDVQGLQLARLFPQSKAMEDALGTLYGRGKLAGEGESVASLLGTSDGEINLAVEGGRVSQLLTELLEIDVARAAMLLGTRKQQVELRCAAGTLEFKDGVATPENFVVDTSETLVTVGGSVDLGDEKLDIVTKGRGKSPSLLTLRSPIEMRGPLKKPAVRPKAGPLVAQLGAAAALGAAAPPLAILPFVEPGKKQEANCEQLIAEVKAKGAVRKPA